MKTKACSVMIRMWKMAQTEPAMMWPMVSRMPVAVSAGLCYPNWREASHLVAPIPTDPVE